MDHTEPYREIAVPVAVFGALRREFAKEAGPLPTIHALHAAGYAAGTEAVQGFKASPSEDVGSVAIRAFWTRLSSFFSKRGWGSLEHSAPHDGIGMLSSGDWAEAGDDAGDEPSCSFTTGFLSGMLTGLAGGPVAVLEVECAGRGDSHCRFAFGSESAIHELYGGLLDGVDLDGALARLQ